eukprot:m.69708 g.69708  ORF g.69708 m.69708 type:complete len:742 (-) comp12081_c0_seq1:63-2288(-)
MAAKQVCILFVAVAVLVLFGAPIEAQSTSQSDLCALNNYGNATRKCGIEKRCFCSETCLYCVGQTIEDLNGLMDVPNITNFLFSKNNVTLPKYMQGRAHAVDLKGNQITSLPSTTFQYMYFVEELGLGLNQISSLEADVFQNMPLLRVLGLPGNPLGELPETVFQNNSLLQELLLRNTQLSSLPIKVFQSLTLLALLDLSSNSLTYIPPTLFKNCVSIEVLLLDHNYLNNIQSEAFSTLTVLSNLLLSHNNLNEVPTFTSPRITSVTFDNNNLNMVKAVNTSFNTIVSKWQENKRCSGCVAVPFLSITNNPVSCTIVVLGVGPQFVCNCAVLYENKDGECIIPSEVWKYIVGAACGGFGAAMVLGLGFFIQKRFTSMRHDLGVHEQLLNDRTNEVMELISAWEISADDVTLVRRIDHGSEGAFGEVWYAEWDGLGVAVKRLRSALFALDEQASQDFEAEVDFLRKCRHRNVVRFFGAGKWEDLPFLVTEYLELGSLSTYLRQSKSQLPVDMTNISTMSFAYKATPATSQNPGEKIKISWEQRLSFAQDIHAGMQYIHTLGRVHRDLKTANVLLSAKLRCKVADFGTMKDIFQKNRMMERTSKSTFSQSLTSTSMDFVDNKSGTLTAGVGTPLYMAPEVIRGESYGAGADMWSFGIVLWELATRLRPDLTVFANNIDWSGPFLVCLEKALTAGVRLPLRKDEAPPGYAELIKRCNELAPQARPTWDDVGEILEELDISGMSD